MASPFYVFRKYQRAFIAIAAVVAMFIFVVADPLMTWLQSSGDNPRRSGKEVIAQWDGGSINRQQLQMLAQRRARISDFLRAHLRLAAGMIEEEGGTPVAPALPDFRLQDVTYAAIQENCISNHIFAELAKESDISISDAFINHYLREWGLRRMGDVEISSLLERAGLSQKALFSGLRELLMAHYYLSSYSLATVGVTPEERWQDWRQINERISVEAAILPSDSFLADVPAPSDAELKDFYEQHKDRIERRMSPDPGFREPRRVKVQYLVANVDDWTQKMLDSVTDEEIADYYERNKRTQFVKTSDSTSIDGLFDDDDDIFDPESTDDAEPSEEADSTEAGNTEVEEENAAEAVVDSEMEADDSATEAGEEMEASAEAEASDEVEAAEAETDDATEASDTVEEAVDIEEPTEEASEELVEETVEEATGDQPAVEDSGQLRRTSPFRLAALQTETDNTDDADEKSESADTSSDEETEADSGDDGDQADGDQTEEDGVEYEPLEKVSDQIRRSLANDKAVVELRKVVDRAYTKLQTTFNPYGFKVVSAQADDTEVPAPPKELSDYKAIAAETGLISEELVLLSQLELSETLVGQAIDAQSRTEFVHQAMFGDKQLYEPYRAVDLAGNSYLVCKTEDVASRVPEFDEIRDAVLAAWKKKEAAKLALAKAEELAKSAQDNGDSVADVAEADGYNVVTTDMFSWLTFGTTPAEMQRGPRIGEAPPLEAIGGEFMTKAFDLEEDDRVALLNFDESSAFVMQLLDREKTKAELQQQFLSDSVNGWYGGRVMNAVRAQAASRRLESQLTEEIGLDRDMLRDFFREQQQQQQ